ncbi:class I SAM-dependent methyltransferase [Motiliproteus sp. SC1-56]|uniref:class I SAM-dependent methyltransferase n=1 Tax=Motiliproteus sp. SC1-56 TaxID=2799565 RepID=UPI001A8FB397|nr:class I SAM-dependent methyltransferase [Motiliproteus sp. SC1-56]
MTRLESAIRRLQAQRLCLDWAAGASAGREGLVLELGLGNGRTYDHLRARLPDREIYVFERQLAAHPDSLPDRDHLLFGDLYATLPGAAETLGGKAILVHADIGSGDRETTGALAAFVADQLPALMRPGALLVSDQPIPLPASEVVPLPAGVPEGRYYIRRYLG